MSGKNNYFITTPIYYVNDKPHIGHAYTTILADVLSRFHRTVGDDVFFLTGLDEHGLKVQQAADEKGIAPQSHCDQELENHDSLSRKAFTNAFQIDFARDLHSNDGSRGFRSRGDAERTARLSRLSLRSHRSC